MSAIHDRDSFAKRAGLPPGTIPSKTVFGIAKKAPAAAPSQATTAPTAVGDECKDEHVLGESKKEMPGDEDGNDDDDSEDVFPLVPQWQQPSSDRTKRRKETMAQLQEEEGAWDCAQYGNRNFARRKLCHNRACGAAKPSHELQNRPAFHRQVSREGGSVSPNPAVEAALATAPPPLPWAKPASTSPPPPPWASLPTSSATAAEAAAVELPSTSSATTAEATAVESAAVAEKVVAASKPPAVVGDDEEIENEEEAYSAKLEAYLQHNVVGHEMYLSSVPRTSSLGPAPKCGSQSSAFRRGPAAAVAAAVVGAQVEDMVATTEAFVRTRPHKFSLRFHKGRLLLSLAPSAVTDTSVLLAAAAAASKPTAALVASSVSSSSSSSSTTSQTGALHTTVAADTPSFPCARIRTPSVASSNSPEREKERGSEIQEAAGRKGAQATKFTGDDSFFGFKREDDSRGERPRGGDRGRRTDYEHKGNRGTSRDSDRHMEECRNCGGRTHRTRDCPRNDVRARGGGSIMPRPFGSKRGVPCRFWKLGDCRQGERCDYSHSGPGGSSGARPEGGGGRRSIRAPRDGSPRGEKTHRRSRSRSPIGEKGRR
jgi:hypothetical protein